MAAYGVLAWLTLWSLIKSGQKIKSVIILSGIIFYGAIMEIIQLKFFPYRSFEILDIVANIIGSFVGYLLFKYFKKL